MQAGSASTHGMRRGHAFLPGESRARSLDFPRPHTHSPRPRGGPVRGSLPEPGRSGFWWNPVGSAPRNGAVAQLGERLVRNEEVSGSIPLSSTIPLALVVATTLIFYLVPSGSKRFERFVSGLWSRYRLQRRSRHVDEPNKKRAGLLPGQPFRSALIWQRSGCFGHSAQHVLQDATVLVVGDLVLGIDPA